MPRVIVPVVSGTVMPGVKVRTGATDDPTPLDVKVMEVKVAAMTMAGAGFCWVPASGRVANVNIPAPGALPRVRPDSVMMTEPVPVAAPLPRVMMIVVLAVTAEVTVNEGTLDVTVEVPVK